MKHLRLLVIASVVAIAANISRADDRDLKIPSGWTPHGDFGKTYLTGFSAPESAECGSACFMIVGTQEENNSSNKEFAAISKTVSVGHLQNQEISLSLRYSQDGPLENKEVWVKFFDEHGEISRQRLRLKESANEHFTQTSIQFLVPRMANKMELGFGLRGYGRFEFGGLKLEVVAQGDSLANRIKSEMRAVTIDPLTFRVDQ